MRRFVKILTFLLCLCLLIPALAPVSASAEGARVVFSASVPDEEGFFAVSVTVYDATFDAFQYSFNFDTSIVTPVSWSSGELATDFNSFAKISDSLQDAMYEGYMPTDSGLINTVGLNVAKAYVAGSDGLLIFTYRFRRIADGSAGLALATSETGESYNSVLPSGGILLYGDDNLETSYVFRLPSVLTGGEGDVEITTQPVMTKAERAENTVILQIGNYAAAKDGALCHIYPGEKQVTPYIKTDENGNGRTMVPVRFVAEALGASVNWDDNTKTVTIAMGGDVVQMTVGSNGYTINGETRTMDAAAEIVDCGDGSGNGRAMVPMRFAAEALGKAVYWDEADRLVIVTEPDEPWQTGRDAETELTEDVLLIISPLLRDLIQ
jgi:hypothetical protein